MKILRAVSHVVAALVACNAFGCLCGVVLLVVGCPDEAARTTAGIVSLCTFVRSL